MEEYPIQFKDKILLKSIQPLLNKVAVFITFEYEGFSKNGGIGTYYNTLSQNLAAAGWYNILVLCQSEQKFQGKSNLAELQHIFSTSEVEDVLELQPVQLSILAEAKLDYYHSYQSMCSLFFVQAIATAFPNARILAEFPEALGFGYHTIQAKRVGLLGDNCITAVTMHGCCEWVFEANESIINDDWFSRACYREQQCFEKADLAFFPSYFLKDKVKSYRWKTEHAHIMPYFIPLITNQHTEENNNSKGENYSKVSKIPVIFFGRLEERKGLLTFIEAVNCLSFDLKNNLHIIFMGKVVSLYSLDLKHLNSQQYIERELENNISYEIISNFSSGKAIQYIKHLKNSIICLTSPQENFPNSALEMGQIPVSLVVADTGGFRETLQLVKRFSAIYWFTPKDAHSLAEMLSNAILEYPQKLSLAERETLAEINNNLLTQKLTYIEQAFNQATISELPQLKITIGLICHDADESLIDCLKSIAVQTYTQKEVIIIHNRCKNEFSQKFFNQARFLFPTFQFIQIDQINTWTTAYNYLVDLASGNYLLYLEPNIILFPFALEKFAQAACKSNAAIVTCPRKDFGAVKRIVNFSGGNLPNLLQTNICGGECSLFSLSLLKRFKPIEQQDIYNQIWAIMAAAVATEAEIAYYPYPLYEYKLFSDEPSFSEPQPREQYFLRQYLSQIQCSDWSHRQIYLLITAIQQLQFLPPQLAQLKTQLTLSENSRSKLEQELEIVKSEVKQAQAEIDAMKTSKFWKLRQIWFRFKEILGLKINQAN